MSNISANGSTQTIYILEDSGTIYYRINSGSLTSVSWPVTITNTNPSSSSVLKILFETNITLNGATTYFICGSAYLQFGSPSLGSQANRTSITIDGVTSYPGLIQNGTSSVPGNANILVYNLSVSAINSTTLDFDGGWLGQKYFGNGATGNVLVNCSSDGDISFNAGGIVGLAAASGIGGQLTVRGCSSTGAIAAAGGGIVGTSAGVAQGSITCESCWSTGATIATDAGGIFGSGAGATGGYALATKCYSTGTIQNDGGGIFGGYAGEDGAAYAQNCYSRGNIEGNGGGIFSRFAAEDSGTTSAINCYSSGTLATAGYGIYGVNQRSGATLTNCYVANNSWSDSTANTNLTGDPDSSDVGATWVKRGTNQPYELNNMGYTPYSTTVINSSSNLIQSYSQTISAGESTVEAIVADASGNDFTILQKSGGNDASYPTITMSAQTGVISTTSATAPGTYTITLRSIGSYNITTFILTISADAVSDATTCCVTTIDERGLDYAQVNNYRIGNRLLLEVSQNPKTNFDGYSQYVKYKMAQGSRKV